MNRYCPVCETETEAFLDYGFKRRADAQCPHCGSLERHRLLLLYLRTKSPLFDGKPRHFLHVAPEVSLSKIFGEACGTGYLSADLNNTAAMEQMDITDIHHPNDSFDTICCSHVLEHVTDDLKAMQELFRVLRPSGFAILNVPIVLKGNTFEDPSIVEPADRQRVYGHFDHVRNYGSDYKDRLMQAGFIVTIISAIDLLDPAGITRNGLKNGCGGDIFIGTKQSE